MSQAGNFTNKAHLYHYRWDYAPAAIDVICAAIAGCAGKQIADLGAGNGLLGKHFLARGAEIYAVEPNQAMLALAQAEFGHHPMFHAIGAQAEATTLSTHSMDAIVIGRALQWFAPEAARQEIRRILKPNGVLAILRVPPADPTIRQAMASIRSAENGWDMQYGGARPPEPPHALYFGHDQYQRLQFSQVIHESWEQFWGNLCSRSVAPDLDNPQLERLQQAARQLFAQLSCDGRFTVETLTTVSLGVMTA